jgi:glyoxylase-like metal-dependent hydrolase (beta-lactamase superfamily II)
MTVEPIVTEMQVPAGMLGPDPVAIDTRCFLVSHTEGVILIDVGPPGSLQAIDEALVRIGAALSDVSDVVLTHSHIDHTGGLADVIDRVPGVVIRAGAGDVGDIHLLDGGDVSVVPSREGDRVRDLEVIETPGHTPGHISLLDRASSLLIAGDAVGNDRGALSFGPPAFTSDMAQARSSLERVESLALDRVLFAHGPEVEDPSAAIRDLLESR